MNGTWIDFGVRRVGHSPFGFGVLEQRVLKSPAGAKKRTAGRSRKSYRRQRAGGIGIRAARNALDSRK